MTQVGVSTLSLILLGLGLARLAGTSLIGGLLKRSLHGLLMAMPLAMAAIAAGLVAFGSSAMMVAALLCLWGLVATAAPVGWWAWMSRALPDQAEAGGGLMVAVIQLAITAGAWIGGLLFDAAGHAGTFTASGAFLVCSALAVRLAARRSAAGPEGFACRGIVASSA